MFLHLPATVNRLANLTLALIFGIIIFPPAILIGLLIRLTSKGPAIHWSSRVGKENEIFKMPKFRTMKVNTPALATNKMKNPKKYLTPIGGFLRQTSMDEYPQLFSILKGDMSFVGPRPALFNQYDLIKLRTSKGVHQLAPGITGWAQINGRDNLMILEKVLLDTEYLKRKSFWFDLKILFITFFRILSRAGISH